MSRGDQVTVERLGFLAWEWEAAGVLLRPLEFRNLVVMPGLWTRIASGTCLTRRGATRRGRRTWRYYCERP